MKFKEQTMEFEFEFTVTGLTREQAQDLLLHIVAEVEAADGEVGGGFHQVEGGSDDESN